ncbi:MAG: hypothetical protein HOO96_26170 [Polyangiaceae bacterium]|nr:hypothetical protein [Polyangiaceae bacterium]
MLSFDNAPIAFTNPTGSFDLVGRDASFGTQWVGSASPWLALDQNGNGRIDDGRELFGSMTILPSGAPATNGFEALRALDADHDGRITEADPAFASLLLWRDRDQDRASSKTELIRAIDAGLVAIDLAYEIRPRCEGDACEVERATFTFRSERGTQRGSVVDVHFAVR